MKYIIYGLNANQWPFYLHIPVPRETIEIDAVMLDDNFQEISQLEQFVKPTFRPNLTNFCKEINCISQQEIDVAPPFPEAVQIFRNWIGYDDDFLLYSWDGADTQQLKNEAELHGINEEWSNTHLNIKEEYKKIKLLKENLGFRAALSKEQIPLGESNHRGIDDIQKLSKIFIRYARFFLISE